jgi:aspartyl protease family protein
MQSDMEPDIPDAQAQPATHKLGRSMVFISWIAALALLTFLSQDWLDTSHNPNRSPTVSTDPAGMLQVILQRNRHGHYISNGKINGQTAVFMLDTGATEVVIPQALAERYQLEYGPESQAHTANGVISVYNTNLDSIELGPLRLNNVRAVINPHMDGEEILLGMSFLKHLKFQQQQDQLILTMP